MFFDVGIKDFIDVLLVALLLYYTYKLMKASGSIKVFTGILVFILIWLVVTQILEMKLLGSIFDTLMNVGVIALIVLFQDEIRRFLLTLGSHRHVSALAHFFSGARKEALKHDDIMPVVMACLSMGKQKVGALIVIEHTTPLDEVVRTGEIIDAAISQRLIENIFFKNSPLHDGAMVISKKTDQSRRLYPASLSRPEHPERTGLASPCGYGHLAEIGCARHHRLRRDRSYFCSLSRTILSSSECRRTGKSADKRKLKLNISEHGQTKFSKNRRYSSTRIIGDRFCYGSDYPGCIGRRRS